MPELTKTVMSLLDKRPVRIIVIAVVTLALALFASIFLSTRAHATTVLRVVDGDTLDVLQGGQQIRVRLLNIDTPESVDPNQPVECLAVEASDHLKSLLPAGTEVSLVYDVERTDRYGRTLAGVRRDGQLINAEMARAGFGVPIKVGGMTSCWLRSKMLGRRRNSTRRGCCPRTSPAPCRVRRHKRSKPPRRCPGSRLVQIWVPSKPKLPH